MRLLGRTTARRFAEFPSGWYMEILVMTDAHLTGDRGAHVKSDHIYNQAYTCIPCGSSFNLIEMQGSLNGEPPNIAAGVVWKRWRVTKGVCCFGAYVYFPPVTVVLPVQLNKHVRGSAMATRKDATVEISAVVGKVAGVDRVAGMVDSEQRNIQTWFEGSTKVVGREPLRVIGNVVRARTIHSGPLHSSSPKIDCI